MQRIEDYVLAVPSSEALKDSLDFALGSRRERMRKRKRCRTRGGSPPEAELETYSGLDWWLGADSWLLL